MAYPVPPRRRRRRGFVLLLITVGIAAALVLGLQLLGDERRLTEYLNAVREAATEHQSSAAVVASIMVGLEELERPMVLSSLEDAVTRATEANEALADSAPPRSAAQVGAYLTVSHQSWLDGLVAFRSAVESLLDDPADVEGIDRLATAFWDFAVGDRAYRSFEDEVAALDGQLETRGFPEVRYIGVAEESLFDVALFRQRIAALKELEARFDVAVSDLRFDPEPVGTQDGVPQVPFTEGFEIQVTIANRGNEPAANLTVGIQLLAFADLADAEVVGEDTRVVDTLEPGQATTLIFDQFDAAAGTLHEVVVRAVLAEDEDPASNEVRFVFFRNESQ